MFRDTFADHNSIDDIESYVRDSFSLDRVRAELADDANTFLLAFMDGDEKLERDAKLRTGQRNLSVPARDAVRTQRRYQGLGASPERSRRRANPGEPRRGPTAGHQTLWLGVWERNTRAISFSWRWQFETVGDQSFGVSRTIRRT